MGANLSSLSSTLIAEGTTGDGANPCLYVFGYGSLMWNPGFQYDHQHRVVARGFGRRFYQGNTSFRGTEELPGRVVTLVEDTNEDTYGLVYKVSGERRVFDVLEHLYEREIENGYTFRMVRVECVETGRAWSALTCIALEKNVWFLGPPRRPPQTIVIEEETENGGDDEDLMHRQMAMEIAMARGKAGPNYEYLIRLADCMRKLFPEFDDQHLYQLEAYVRDFLNEQAA